MSSGTRAVVLGGGLGLLALVVIGALALGGHDKPAEAPKAAAGPTASADSPTSPLPSSEPLPEPPPTSTQALEVDAAAPPGAATVQTSATGRKAAPPRIAPPTPPPRPPAAPPVAPGHKDYGF